MRQKPKTNTYVEHLKLRTSDFFPSNRCTIPQCNGTTEFPNFWLCFNQSQNSSKLSVADCYFDLWKKKVKNSDVKF